MSGSARPPILLCDFECRKADLVLKSAMDLLQAKWVALLGQQDRPIHTLQKGLVELKFLGLR
ncbi:hypothetical protein [Variovorax boronicumulans]|uniref:hypothetical protein n=1 Tax=Variovorax boronicumulans TaxID=436515 RepID=UPI00117E58F8|nr:hypothetical protein [Variovorax boronicumulans]